jgi:uncharacterized protein with HEPN domain
MYDKTLILETLQEIERMLCMLIEGTEDVNKVDELLISSGGMLKLNGICMSLLVIGEEFKKIDKYTNRQLLPLYPSVLWRAVIGMRDKIAHHYFDIDAEKVFSILRNDIPPLLSIVKQMQKDLE